MTHMLSLNDHINMAFPGRENPATGLSLLEELMLVDMVGGGERGFNERADILTRTRDGVDANQLWREFRRTLEIMNRGRDELAARFVFRQRNQIEGVMVPSGDVDFEEMTEFGQPKGLRGITRVYAGYPYKLYDLAVRYTWMFLAKATADEVRQLNNQALEADRRLLFSQIMRAIFNPANRTATAPDAQPVTVYAFYNADGQVPPRFRTTTHSGTHTHYITSGAATIDPVDLQDLEEHLYHHGYRFDLGYQLIVFMNRTEGLLVREFEKGTAGALYSFIPNELTSPGLIVPADQRVLGAPTGRVRGEIGTYGPFHVVEDDYWPPGYVVALASGGEQNIGNPIGIFEDSDYGIGLDLVPGQSDEYPLTDSFYRHGFGTAVRHRGAGVVMQISAAGSYTAPTLYA